MDSAIIRILVLFVLQDYNITLLPQVASSSPTFDYIETIFCFPNFLFESIANLQLFTIIDVWLNVKLVWL